MNMPLSPNDLTIIKAALLLAMEKLNGLPESFEIARTLVRVDKAIRIRNYQAEGEEK